MYNIGSLSGQGWVDDPPTVLSYVMSCYILTDAAQTVMFGDNVISLANTYHKYINDPDKMAVAVKQDITRLIDRHFPECDVTCRAKEVEDGSYALLLYATAITSKGERIELSRVAEVSASNLRRIININNYGDAKDLFDRL